PPGRNEDPTPHMDRPPVSCVKRLGVMLARNRLAAIGLRCGRSTLIAGLDSTDVIPASTAKMRGRRVRGSSILRADGLMLDRSSQSRLHSLKALIALLTLGCPSPLCAILSQPHC